MFVTATTIYKWKYCEAAQINTEIIPCSCMGKSQDQVWGFSSQIYLGGGGDFIALLLWREIKAEAVAEPNQKPLELCLAAGLHGCLIVSSS